MPTFHFCTFCGPITNSWSTFDLGFPGGPLGDVLTFYYFPKVEILGLGWKPIIIFFCFVWDTLGQIRVYGDIMSNKHKGALSRQFANVLVSLCRRGKACVRTVVVNVVLFVHRILKNHYGGASVSMSILWLFQCPVLIKSLSSAAISQIYFNEGNLFHICL